MATTRKWVAPAAIATALSTDLNALGNGSYSAASAAIDNRTNLYQYMWLEVYLASLTPTAGGNVSVYMVTSVDAAQYSDGGAAVAAPACTFIAAFDLSTSAGVKVRTSVFPIQVPPLLFKLILLNSAGAALAASGSTLKYRLGYEQAV